MMDSDLLILVGICLLGSLVSLLGGLFLLERGRRTAALVEYVTPFAAGALLAAAFVDLLPEAAHDGHIEVALHMVMIGIVVFFLIERFVHWFHHHHANERNKLDSTVPLIIIGDTVHNFIDGIAIAAAFLVSVPTGIVTTLAVAAHEIPQEVGDFGLLLKKGMSRRFVIWANLLSALATTVAAVIFYQLGQAVSLRMDIILGLVAGFFIYIAVSDIIPTIHKSEGDRLAGLKTGMLILGIVVVSLMTTIMHSYIEA